MKDSELERILKALGNKRRMAIIRLLKKGELSVGEIAERIKLSFKSTSRHLSILTSADLLEREQKSTLVFYRLSNDFRAITREAISNLI